MATAALPLEPQSKQKVVSDEPRYAPGVLAGIEVSDVPNVELTDEQKACLADLVKKAEKRDYPARLVEVIQAWEAALFYRGFQFLVPLYGGGWKLPEAAQYGPQMQMDLALLPTNIYSARGQMIIAALTRTVPGVRFGPQNGNNDAQITAAEGSDKFMLVIKRNNDFITIQTTAARYAWTDGRWVYWSRFVKDGQSFGWEEDDEPELIPETAPEYEGAPPQNPIDAAAAEISDSNEATAAQEDAGQQAETEEQADKPVPLTQRTPRGREVRTCHGKLETKIVPMMANKQSEVDVMILEWEVDISRSKAMHPDVADDIKPGTGGPSDGQIARLARQNVKLGMQSSYVTSDSIAQDCTERRVWMRPSWFMHIPAEKQALRDKFLEMFPNGCLAAYAGDVLAYARNESMDDSISIGHAYDGDGQNRNAMGTSTMPIQKRLNNWLDLMNDFFVRCVPKKFMDNKTFNVEALRGQTNIPGDTLPFKWKPGVPITELVWVEPPVNAPVSLADFIKEYSGPLSELLSGAYPALAGGDVGTADSGVAIATQRDSALGRLAPTWHEIKRTEAESDLQLVRWGAKCRDKSINEQIPGGQIVRLELNDLKSNIMVYPESDENFPETYTQKKNSMMTLFNDAAKNPMLGEVVYNPSNVEFFQNLLGMKELYIPQVAARNKELADIELLLGAEPMPGPMVMQAQQQIEMAKGVMEGHGIDPGPMLAQAEQELQQKVAMSDPMAVTLQEVASGQAMWKSSEDVDMDAEDVQTSAETLMQWMTSETGRSAKKNQRLHFANVRLHYLETIAALQQKAAQAGVQGKPPSMSISFKDVLASGDKPAAEQMLAKGGITPTAGAMQPPGGPPAAAGAKAPANPLPTGAPEQPPSRVQ